jgi:hypothetical protein
MKGYFMITCKKIGFLLLLVGACSLFAQSTDYLIIDAPVGAQPASKVLWVKWAGLSRSPLFAAPDSGTIFYDRAPGGGNITNYRYSIKNAWVDTATGLKQSNILESNGTVKKRGTAFKAEDQAEMGFGVFYCVVAFPCKNVFGNNDTLISNEFILMIESPNAVDWSGPKDSITELTPTFKWSANAGVPYYHIILSDDVIKADTNKSGDIDLQGLSIIWQAITPNTQMVYGAPDPSHTITAEPPPLSPGKRYSWLVLNNYGNHPAFSSTKVKIPAGEFVIKGKALKKPKPLYPINTELNSITNKKFSFRWTNLDSNANTYKVYAYVATDSSASLQGIKAQLIVWQTEVSATRLQDTMSVEIDASSILTSNKYIWNVIAVDSKGAGSTGDTAGFNYFAPTGTLNIHTHELIRVPKDSTIVQVENQVGLVEVKVEVLDGSLEAPLLFYTDLSGNLSRKRPTGSYRITAIKSEFESQTKTISLQDGQTLDTTFYLKRPEATIFGKIVDEAGKGINLVTVFGASDLKDTISTKTDASGNFILKCYGSDWRVWSEMIGYKSVLPKKTTVASGQNLNFGTTAMVKNPFTLSGIVKNTSGDPLLGVKIKLFQNGVQIDEIPSTPQNGAFAFSIPSGTYIVIVEKTGFSSVNSTIDMLSSKIITITMDPGAAIVNGFVFGKTWVNSRNDYVLAPITSATLKFINIGTGSDTIKVVSDKTYGDFKVSLPGGQKYIILSSATGFGVKSVPCTLVTQVKTTQNFYDTLNSFATINGIVKLKSDGTAFGNCVVNVLTSSGSVVASGKTSSDGTFEIRNIKDGTYSLVAGKDGYVLDSIAGSASINISNGKPDESSITFFMKVGDKIIKWVASDSGAIKLKSPVVKNFSFSDSLSKAGAGAYVLHFDAKADSIIDCSYHTFSVDNSENIHIDTVQLLLKHKATDSTALVNGTVQLVLTAKDTLDSVMVYYKDVTAASYSVLKSFIKNGLSYTFNVLPQRDGSTLFYYFVGYKGNDIYGYDQEPFKVFVKPDITRLSKYEIVPSSKDTLVFPASYDVTFSFKGYFSSSFIPDSTIDGQGIQWSLNNAQGCSISKNSGVSVTIHTGSAKSSLPVILTVTIDTTKNKLVSGVSPVMTETFNISGTLLKSVKVRRIDAGNPNPITTSAVDRAEFAADGFDGNGNILKISPNWKIDPVMAGIISPEGVFKPSRKFVGIVRIYAEASGLTGEYSSESQSEPGLVVRFMIVKKGVADTATNGSGCAVVFPANVVSDNDIGILDLVKEVLKNKIELKTGKYSVLTNDAYEIKQLENISLNTSIDSIQLLIDLPSDLKNPSEQLLYIGNWNIDSLKWDILGNSVVKDQKVTVKLPHFSKYTILSEAGNSGYLKVSPNAFSPYVNQRQVNSFTPYYGTCIQFQIQTQNQINARLSIYNVVGDLVWAMDLKNLNSRPYSVWWDGRAVARELNSSDIIKSVGPNGETVIVPKGEKMCRNGRYFVVLTAAEEIDKKIYRFMKPVVLMK